MDEEDIETFKVVIILLIAVLSLGVIWLFVSISSIEERLENKADRVCHIENKFKLGSAKEVLHMMNSPNATPFYKHYCFSWEGKLIELNGNHYCINQWEEEVCEIR